MMNNFFTTTFFPVWLRGRKALLVFTAGVYAIIYISWLQFKWTDPAYESLIANLGYLPLGIFSAISALYASRQNQLNSRTQQAWRLIAFGMIFLAIGDIIYTVLELTKGVGFPDVPDIFYLAFYPMAFIGLIAIPTQVNDSRIEKTWRFDLAAITISALAIFWYFIIAPTAEAGGEDWASRLVAGAYPAMDVPLLTSIISLLYRKSEINTRQSLYILGLGLFVYVMADIGYAWLVLGDLYSSSGLLIDGLWTLSYFLIGLAALRQANPYLDNNQAEKQSRTNWQTLVFPILATTASIFMSVYAAITGNGAGLQANGLFAGTAITLFILMARQVITARENARLYNDLESASAQLRVDAQILERRVAERTRDLESQTQKMRLVAQISQEVTSANDLQNMLHRFTTLILQSFSFHHTGVYLLDEKKDYAVLIASPTEAGGQLLADGHKVRVGEKSLVSQVAASGEPKIFSGASGNVQLNNPLLPNTQSQLVLPLEVKRSLIGVLDLQSDQPQAFNQDDIAIMRILADQLAAAIEQTRLLQQVEQNLSDLRQAYGQFTREGWKTLGESGLLGRTGYRFDNIRIQPISEVPAHGDEVMKTGNSMVHDRKNTGADENKVSIPIKLRGQTIGVVSASLKDGYAKNTISTLELAIERLAQALESARLYEQARLRADREQTIAQVAANISSATEFDTILRTTVEEIGKSIGDAEVSIQIISDTTE